MRRFPSRFFALGSIMFATTSAFGGSAPASTEHQVRHFCSPFDASEGVVAVNDPIAAEVGASVLAAGGNAVDAAVAVAFALNVVEPLTSGIGGGGFMIVHMTQSDETRIVDFRETAPDSASATMFNNLTFAQASVNGISVGVPGEPRGLEKALDEWGTMPWADLVAPAIQLARSGVPVSRYVAENINSPRTAQGETAQIFRPNGIPLQEGELLVQSDLADTLELLAMLGPDVFYEGEIAQDIVDAQAGGTYPGGMTLLDLAAYTPVVRMPVFDTYRGYTIASAGSPSSGGLTTLEVLGMLERFPLGKKSKGYGVDSPKTEHVLIEGLRLGLADRAVWMGDDDFVDVPEDGLLSPAYIVQRSSLIDPLSRMATPTAGNPWPFDQFIDQPLVDEGPVGETTHFSIVDRDGNTVSCTVSIEQLWGTGITVPGRGFLLNNELTDFNRPAAAAPGTNNAAPGKRPRSSMAPTIMFKNGEPVAALGSPGGVTIISSVTQTIINLLDHQMTPEQAILEPRLSVALTASNGTNVTAEPGVDPNVITALKALGHTFTAPAEIGAVNAVFMDAHPPRQCGVGDPRRGGAVARPWP